MALPAFRIGSARRSSITRDGVGSRALPVERKRTERLEALTGLRFVAALLVVMFHFLAIHVGSGTGVSNALRGTAARIVASGFTGVGFFFLLSGFILAYTYIGGEGRMSVTPSHFWQARFARIYPLYALAMLVAVVPYLQWGQWHEQFCVGHPSALSGNQPILTGVSSVFLLEAWLPCTMTWNAPAWSLSVEAVFYLLFPLIALGLVRVRGRSLLVVAVLSWLVMLAIALAYIGLRLDASAMHAAWWERYWAWLLYANPLARLPEFLIGVALGRYFLGRDVSVQPRGIGRLASPRYLSVVAAIGVVVVWSLGPFPLILFNQVVLDPLYALLIYCLACGGGPINAVFSWPAMVLLGEASYGVYILHWPIRNWFGHYVPRLPIPTPAFLAPSTVYFLVYLCVVIAASIVSWRVVERPARRLILNAFKRRRALRNA